MEVGSGGGLWVGSGRAVSSRDRLCYFRCHRHSNGFLLSEMAVPLSLFKLFCCSDAMVQNASLIRKMFSFLA